MGRVWLQTAVNLTQTSEFGTFLAVKSLVKRVFWITVRRLCTKNKYEACYKDVKLQLLLGRHPRCVSRCRNLCCDAGHELN